MAESSHKKEEPLVIDRSMLASSTTSRPSVRTPYELPETKLRSPRPSRVDARIDFGQDMSFFPPLTLMLIAPTGRILIVVSTRTGPCGPNRSTGGIRTICGR